jgi:hypothetical protein
MPRDHIQHVRRVQQFFLGLHDQNTIDFMFVFKKREKIRSWYSEYDKFMTLCLY